MFATEDRLQVLEKDLRRLSNEMKLMQKAFTKLEIKVMRKKCVRHEGKKRTIPSINIVKYFFNKFILSL